MTSFDGDDGRYYFNEVERRREPSMREVQEELRQAYSRAVSRESSLFGVDPAPSSQWHQWHQAQSVVTLTEAQAALIRDQIRAMPPTTTPRNQERSNPMDARMKALFAFMDNPPDGKYDAPRPTDEQLATVLPWLIDQTVTWAQGTGYGTVATNVLHHLSGSGIFRRAPEFFNAAGYDCHGRDREGYNKDGYDAGGYNKDGYNPRGFNVHGFNADGYNRDGYDQDGFNKQGLDYYGKTREETIAALVSGWSKEHLAVMAVKLAERQAKADAEAAAKAAELAAATTAADTANTEGTGQAPVVTTEDEAVEPVPVTSVTSTKPARIMLLDEDGTRSIFDDLVDEDEDEDEVFPPAAVTITAG